MSRVNEDELLRSLTWSDQNYTLAEIVNKHPLPQLTRVYRGFDGGLDSPSLGHGEVLTLHAVRETQKLAAEDINGNKTSIALDCPYNFYILPPSQDCNLEKCKVEQLASIFPTVKYVLVLQAHYGTKMDEDMTMLGEVLEILSIDKRKKSTKVKNVESGHIVTLTPSCTGEFKPLRDYKSYCVKDLKSQFNLPVNVHFFLPEGDVSGEFPEELQQLVAKSPNVTIVGDIEETLVIATTVSNEADLKFCYEIPKDLELKVEVTVEFLIGERHYQEVLTSLDKGFDVVKLLGIQQPEFFKRNDIITQHKYELVKDLFLNIARGGEIVEEVAPVLPPRKPKLKHSTSDPVSPPQVPIRPTEKLNGTNRPVSIADWPVVMSRPSPPKVAPRPKSCVVPSPNFHPRPPHPNKIPEEPDYYNIPDDQRSESPQSQSETTGNSSKPEVQMEPDGTKQETKDGEDSSAKSKPPKNLPPDAWRVLPVAPNASKPPLVALKPSQRAPPTSMKPPPKKTAITSSPEVLPKFSSVAPGKSQGPPVPPSRPIPAQRKIVNTPQYPTPTAPDSHSNPLATESESKMTNETTKPCLISNEHPGDEEDKLPYNTYEEVKQPEDMKDDGSHGESIYVTNTAVIQSVVGDREQESWETEDPYEIVARIPQDLSNLSVTEVCRVLTTLHMECYLATFKAESIDGNLLKSLGNEELESLNVNPFHRKKLINFINGWRPKH